MLQRTTKTRIISIILTVFLCITQCFAGVPVVSAATNTTIKQSNTTSNPTESPTAKPANSSTAIPTNSPTAIPTNSPTAIPTNTPTAIPTSSPSTTSGSSITTDTPDATQTPSGPTAQIRLMFTTDLHGALTTTNYETGSSKATGTLARCATLIKQARAEKHQNNTFLFDLGDALYDYSTDYIFEHDSTSEQPIYSAMKSLGYDAITLGNHEFDYNLSYIQNQIANSGLQDICVVSNVRYATTRKHVWKENMMLTRTVTLSDGNTMDIKIGIIGETQPGLSTKRSKYTNTLSTQDIVESTQEQATALKAAGADLIVVLAHSGVGTETPSSGFSNVGYALTKIPEVDVVLCGHAHQYFPSNRAASAKYYELSGVDKETGLANGKNLIMVADKGAAIGIADLTISKSADSTLQIVDRTSNIQEATANVDVDNDINNNYMGTWKNTFVATYSNILGEISNPSSYNNYFAALEDNSLIQLINDAKMTRALKIINTSKTDYAKLPVIAASTYIKSGSDDDKEFVSFSDCFLESYLSNVQIYRTGIFLYQISGKQLKEWMEWSASAYQTTSEATTVSSSSIDDDEIDYSQTLLQSNWNSNFSNFYVFDGVEYVIDTTVDPRYDIAGNKISDNQRITSMTRNGVPISDTDQFIIATNKLDTSTNSLITEINAQKIYGAASLRWRTVVKDYLEALSLNSTLGDVADNNWHVTTAKNSSQVVKSALTSETVAAKKEWITGTAAVDSNFIYYNIDMSKENTDDTTGPNIIATSLSDELSHSAVTVAVQTHDRSGVASVKYAKGKYSKTADIWQDAATISSSFDCKENGIYTILATDTIGNKSVHYIRIQNINANTISTPIVDTFTNRKTSITGTAPAKSTVYIKISGGKTYSTTATASGTFSCTIPAQKADTLIYIYAVDSSGRTSPRVTITVSRTGPNKPTLNAVNSNSKKVTGNINDTFAYPILYVESKNTVYVPETDGKALYKASSAYDASTKIVEVPCNVTSSGGFTITLPCYLSGETPVVLYTLDNSSRKSNNISKKVVQKKPPKPSLATSYVSNGTTTVKVSCGERCTMYVKIDKKVYKHNSVTYDSSSHSYIYEIKIPKTNTGKKIKIYASNSVGNSAVISATRKETVPNTPTVSSVNLKTHTIKGKVHFIDADFKKSTLSKSRTKVYVKFSGKTYKAKVSTKGTFTVTVPSLTSGKSYTIWATNVNGTSPVGKKTAK